MQSTFKWLLVRAGHSARIRVGAALRDARNSSLTAICDVDSERAETLSKQLDITPESFTDYSRALAESGAEGGYIATQARSHVPLGIQAVKAGKHLLCEKPLGLDTHDGMKLYRECRNVRVKSACSNYRRLSEQYKVVEKLIRDGSLGEFTGGWMNWVTCEKSVGNTPLSRDLGGSPLKTLAFYIIDIVHHLFGMPTEVQARCCTTFNPATDTEDTACVILAFPNGALFSLNVFFNEYAAGHDEMEFYGTRGSIALKNWPPGGNEPVVFRGQDTGEKIFNVITNLNWYLPTAEDFIQAVGEDREPVCTILSALKTEIITDAIFRAEISGKTEMIATEGVI